MATYYVDNRSASAKDTNSGSSSAPWLTIQHAANVAKAGDTVYVKAGTYKPFEIESSGTKTQPIVFSAYPGQEHNVIIDGTGTSVRGLIQAYGKSYYTINGFHLQDAPTDGIFVEGSKSGSYGVTITNNEVTNTGNSGIYAAGLRMGNTTAVGEYRLFGLTIEGNDVSKTNTPSGQNEAITVGGGTDGFVLRNNWVHDTDQFGIDVKLGARNGEISGNVIENVEKHGIYLDSGSRTIENVQIFNNTIHDSQNGIVLAREAVRTPKAPNINNIDIYDNLIYKNAMSGIVAYKHNWDPGTGKFNDVVISSNTVYGDGVNGIRLVAIEDFATNFVVKNNVVFGHKININNGIGAVESSNKVSTGTLSVASGDGAAAATAAAAADATTAGAGFQAHYTLGHKAITTADDIVFNPAAGISHGTIVVRSSTHSVAGTSDDALYDAYGFGDSFGFDIPVPEPGVYRVELHLAELYHQTAGKRVFDVALEGAVPASFNDIDIVAKAGGRDVATTLTATVKVTDSVLNLEAIHLVDHAMINAFSVYYADSPF